MTFTKKPWIWLSIFILASTVFFVCRRTTQNENGSSKVSDRNKSRLQTNSTSTSSRVVRVVSGRDGSPIKGATVIYPNGEIYGTSREVIVETDPSGAVQIIPACEGIISVKAPRHVGKVVKLPLAEQETRVLLTPAGSVELRLVDEDGSP